MGYTVIKEVIMAKPRKSDSEKAEQPPEEAGTDNKVPTDEDIISLADEIDKALAEGGEGGEMTGEETAEEAVAKAEAAEGESPEAGGEEGAGGTPEAVLAERLGISTEKARDLWDAAQLRDDLKGMGPEELADMLTEDYGLRMELEKQAVRAKSGEAEPSGPTPIVPPPGVMGGMGGMGGPGGGMGGPGGGGPMMGGM